MQKLFSIVIIVTLAVVGLLAISPVANAVDVFPDCGSAPGNVVCENKASGGGIFGPGGIINNIIQVLSLGIGAVSVIMIVVGGFKFIVSSGDPQGTASARNTILYAVIGLVVALSAQLIVTFVLGRL